MQGFRSPEILMQVFNDILIRDIAVRHNIKNTLTLQQLAVWLISNSGKLISGNNLRKMFAIGSSASIMEYLLFFNDAYLFFFIPKFSYSQKVQIVNPKKVYAIDTGLVNVNSTLFSDDLGRVFENMNRELDGLAAAMDFFKMDNGIIVTMDQADTFETRNKTITAIPFYEWVLQGLEP